MKPLSLKRSGIGIKLLVELTGKQEVNSYNYFIESVNDVIIYQNCVMFS